jgi:homoserine kinase
VLSGSQALAVPFGLKKGEWILKENSEPGDHSLLDYIKWLKVSHLIPAKTAEKMMADFTIGWRYQADIPIGYGLGSSGAFVAAL